MGGYLTRTRAWVYIAFYDEYAGKHINWSAGLSLVFIIPLYWYGIHVNRVKELNYNMYYYAWRTIDKRNRLVHNLCMEQFEVHMEQLQDLLLDIKKEGAAVFDNLPEEKTKVKTMDYDTLAYIHDISGLNNFIEKFIQSNNFPEHVKSRLRSYVCRYSGTKSKAQIAYEINAYMKGGR